MGVDSVTTIKNEAKKQTIYIISQKENDDDMLVINPFKKQDNFFEELKHKNIQIMVDVQPDLNILKKIKAKMYNFLESAILESNYSDVFWYKILASFIIGILMFFFAEIVIPDPIPLIDEIAIASVVSVLFYFLISKINLFSFISPKKIDKYSIFIDSIQVIENKSLKLLNDCYINVYKNYLVNTISIFENIDLRNNIKKEILTEIKKIEINDLSLIKEIIMVLNKKYNFKKIKNKNIFLKAQNKLLLSYERFFFYYTVYELLFK